MAESQREFYPVFNREGLVIDVRHNRGGNIDSWILEKLLRKAWFYWQPRVGNPYWNMQYAFRGHVVVLMNEFTASDGEAFAERFRWLGLGPLIGNRRWGGEIWLTREQLPRGSRHRHGSRVRRLRPRRRVADRRARGRPRHRRRQLTGPGRGLPTGYPGSGSRVCAARQSSRYFSRT
jgi:hypothetical protein